MDDARKRSQPKGLFRVFVSYSRHDNEVTRVHALLEWLSELADYAIEFVFDQNLQISDDTREFENSIAQYSAVIIVGTRKYKEKVLQGSFGVSREFGVIMPMKENRSLSVFPIKLDDSFSDCFPEMIQGPLAADFHGLIQDPTTLKISHHIRTKYLEEATRLIKAIKAHFATNSRREEELKTIKRKLFFETKHEALNLPIAVFNGIHVKTSFFRAVSDKSAHLFIGRKGSGKSFLTDYFTRNPIIVGTVPINIHLRDFNLLNIFTLRSSSSLSKDIGKIISQTEIFEASWSVTYVVACILHLYAEVKAGRIYGDLHKLNKIFQFLDGLGLIDEIPQDGRPTHLPLQILQWSAEKVFHIVDAGIRLLKGDYASAISSISSLKDPVKLIPAIITRPVLNEFRYLTNIVRPVFLLTVDGFDAKFDRFRRDTYTLVYGSKDREERVVFEIDWLIGLIDATQRFVDALPGSAIASMSQCKIQFLVTLPRDRFSELQRGDREAFRLRHKHVEIRWSGPELMNLLRKRLETYFEKRTKKSNGDDVAEMLYKQFEESIKWIGNIPDTITLSHNRTDINIDLFSYVLRHSFWRPRDILYHIAELILLSETSMKRGRPITSEIVKRCVRNTIFDIIKTEFIGEFSSIFPKLEECLAYFKRGGIEMDYATLYSNLAAADFRLSSGDVVHGVDDRIDFLFEIGFIGIVLSDRDRGHFQSSPREAFAFSDSIDRYRLLDRTNKQNARWVIHPIFSEFLQLDTSNAPFLLNYTREYLADGDW
jgi:hypothetical protein